MMLWVNNRWTQQKSSVKDEMKQYQHAHGLVWHSAAEHIRMSLLVDPLIALLRNGLRLPPSCHGIPSFSSSTLKFCLMQSHSADNTVLFSCLNSPVRELTLCNNNTDLHIALTAVHSGFISCLLVT